jgi:hypothetical protein
MNENYVKTWTDELAPKKFLIQKDKLTGSGNTSNF